MNDDLAQTVVRLKFEIDKLISENKELKDELQRLSSDKFFSDSSEITTGNRRFLKG
tara:strand:+ start:206 stop:373 length:168 start_codon:yes stop_codon:yes gene_type:complete